MKYLNPELETMSRTDLENYQISRLKEILKKVSTTSFYSQKFKEQGLDINLINSIEDIRKLPFTTKDDLRNNYPFGMSAVPMEEVVRIHSSSGTTGNPTVVLHSQQDLDWWAEQIARSLYMVGLRKSDVFQNSSGYGMFTGGLGFQYGAEKLGMVTVPAAAGNSKRQVKFIVDFGTTAIHAIPSYATRLAEVMAEEGYGVGLKPTTLKTLKIGRAHV